MKSLFALTLALVLTALATAAPEPADLGRGLSYWRIHSLGDDTAAFAAAKPGALVVDLRHASAAEEALPAFLGALERRAQPGQLFVLVSPATPRTLAQALEKSAAKFLLLGTNDARPTPTIAVSTTAANDRIAYDAFEAGTPLEKLVTGKIEKERYDEATLVKEFKNGYHGTDEPEAEVVTPAVKTEETAAEKAPTPPTDRVLQRAIHLHRALLSLRR